MTTDSVLTNWQGATVRRVADDRPWHWLQLGWQDLCRAPGVSLSYGVGLVVVSYALAIGLWQAGLIYLVLPLAGGFLLVAPLLAVGLYDVSRRLEAGEPTGLRQALTDWQRPVAIGSFGIVLLLLHFAWIRTAMLWFVLYFHDHVPPLDSIPLYLIEPRNLPFLVIGSAMGAGFALLTFTVSAISLPLLLTRDIDVVTAMTISLRAVIANPKAMALWAGLIVLFTSVGLVTFFVGLGVLFPLVAHASWHASRDIVG